MQQRVSDDREELLALENAKIVARRAAGNAARNRDEFLSDRQSARLADQETARAVLEAGLRDHAFALDELAVLSDDTEVLSAAQPTFDLRFQIRGPRAGRLSGDADLSTPVLPGDIVVVEVLDALDVGQ